MFREDRAKEKAVGSRILANRISTIKGSAVKTLVLSAMARLSMLAKAFALAELFVAVRRQKKGYATVTATATATATANGYKVDM